MKNWSSQEVSEYISGQRTILKAMIADFPKVEGDEQENARIDYDVLFRDAHPLANETISVPEALRRFQMWLLDNYVRPGMAVQEYLSVSIERQYGREKVTFTLGAHFDINSGAGRTANYDRLVDAINIEHMRYARDRAQNGTSDQNPASDSSAHPGEIRVQADRLVVEVKDGKRMYKVKAGQFTRFGVPFYNEHIKASGVNPEEIPDSGYDLKNYDAVIQMNGEKPVRVVRLIKHHA